MIDKYEVINAFFLALIVIDTSSLIENGKMCIVYTISGYTYGNYFLCPSLVSRGVITYPKCVSDIRKTYPKSI